MTFYKLRTFRTNRGRYDTSSLTVPSDFARAMRAAGVEYFTAHLTPEGLLYRPYHEERPLDPLPAWLRERDA